MSGKVTGKTGESTSGERGNFVSFLALILTQLCIKMFWRSLYIAVPQVESVGAQHALGLAGVSLFAAAGMVQFIFIENLRLAGNSQHFDNAQLGCGAMLALTYSLWFLPSATTILEIFRVGTWVSFVFNIGCLAEVMFGLFREGANALSGE